MNPVLLRCTIEELGIGTFKNLVTAKLDTPLIDLMRLFISERISSIPIVDDNSIIQKLIR